MNRSPTNYPRITIYLYTNLPREDGQEVAFVYTIFADLYLNQLSVSDAYLPYLINMYSLSLYFRINRKVYAFQLSALQILCNLYMGNEGSTWKEHCTCHIFRALKKLETVWCYNLEQTARCIVFATATSTIGLSFWEALSPALNVHLGALERIYDDIYIHIISTTFLRGENACHPAPINRLPYFYVLYLRNLTSLLS